MNTPAPSRTALIAISRKDLRIEVVQEQGTDKDFGHKVFALCDDRSIPVRDLETISMVLARLLARWSPKETCIAHCIDREDSPRMEAHGAVLAILGSFGIPEILMSHGQVAEGYPRDDRPRLAEPVLQGGSQRIAGIAVDLRKVSVFGIQVVQGFRNTVADLRIEKPHPCFSEIQTARSIGTHLQEWIEDHEIDHAEVSPPWPGSSRLLRGAVLGTLRAHPRRSVQVRSPSFEQRLEAIQRIQRSVHDPNEAEAQALAEIALARLAQQAATQPMTLPTKEPSP